MPERADQVYQNAGDGGADLDDASLGEALQRLVLVLQFGQFGASGHEIRCIKFNVARGHVQLKESRIDILLSPTSLLIGCVNAKPAAASRRDAMSGSILREKRTAGPACAIAKSTPAETELSAASPSTLVRSRCSELMFDLPCPNPGTLVLSPGLL